jgi:phage repressor protein C with HTH and peptisase S24 domain
MTQDAAGIWQRMAQVWKVKGYRELGEKLGRPAGTIASRKHEQRVPREHILWTALQTGCRLEWLETGEGPIYRETLLVGDLTAPLQEAVRLMLDASEEAQATWLRVARLLSRLDQVSPMHPIMTGVIAAEYHNRIAEAMQTDVPDTPAD